MICMVFVAYLLGNPLTGTNLTHPDHPPGSPVEYAGGKVWYLPWYGVSNVERSIQWISTWRRLGVWFSLKHPINSDESTSRNTHIYIYIKVCVILCIKRDGWNVVAWSSSICSEIPSYMLHHRWYLFIIFKMDQLWFNVDWMAVVIKQMLTLVETCVTNMR